MNASGFSKPDLEVFRGWLNFSHGKSMSEAPQILADLRILRSSKLAVYPSSESLCSNKFRLVKRRSDVTLVHAISNAMNIRIVCPSTVRTLRNCQLLSAEKSFRTGSPFE
jgi:hypothetical protein